LLQHTPAVPKNILITNNVKDNDRSFEQVFETYFQVFIVPISGTEANKLAVIVDHIAKVINSVIEKWIPEGLRCW
jgi:hypothetical protein